MELGDLISAVKSGDLDRVNSALAAEPTMAKASDDSGVSLLMLAIYYDQPAVAEALVGHRKDDLDVFEASALGYADMVKRLVGADRSIVRSFSADGFTPLHLAAYFGKADTVWALLNLGADPNLFSRNPLMVAPLHSALSSGNVEIARTLLDMGADPNAASQEGWVALHYAADIGDAELARLLITKGANPDMHNNMGTTPSDLAVEVGHEHVAEAMGK